MMYLIWGGASAQLTTPILLVGGIPTPLKNISQVSWDDDIPPIYIWKHNPNVPNHQPEVDDSALFQAPFVPCQAAVDQINIPCAGPQALHLHRRLTPHGPIVHRYTVHEEVPKMRMCGTETMGCLRLAVHTAGFTWNHLDHLGFVVGSKSRTNLGAHAATTYNHGVCRGNMESAGTLTRKGCCMFSRSRLLQPEP